MSVDPYPGVEQAQAWDATLQALADLVTSPNTAPYFSDVDQAALMTVSPFARSFLDDADAGSMKATLEFGSGVANRVALWADTDTLTSDGGLYFDPLTDALSIGTSSFPAGFLLYVAGAARIDGNVTASQDLTVLQNGSVGNNFSVGNHCTLQSLTVGVAASTADGTIQYASGDFQGRKAGAWVSLTGAGLGSGALITASGTATYAAYWTSTTTLTGTGNLLVTGTGIQSGRLGVAYAPPSNVWLRSGAAGIDSLHLGSGDTLARWPLDCEGDGYMARLGVGQAPSILCEIIASWCIFARLALGTAGQPRWPLDCPGQGHIGQLGVQYGPPSAVWFRTSSAAFDSVVIGRSDAVPRWPLDCAGLGYVAQLGVHYGADTAVTDGVHLRCKDVRFDNLGVWYGPVAGLSIRAGNSHFDSAGFGYAGGSGYYIRAGSTYVDSFWSGTHVNAGTHVQAGTYLSCFGAVDSRWGFVNWSTSYFANTAHFAAACGFGPAPVANINIRTDNMHADYVGIYGAPDSRFGLRVYHNIYCDANPYHPTGGPWVAYSDERLKHHITEIPQPLETLCALHGILYEWREPKDGQLPGVHMGVLAQEVEQVLPEWVGELDGYKTTRLSRFEALTIEAFKALVHRLDALEQKE